MIRMSHEESHSGQDNLRNISQRSDMGVQGIKNDSKKRRNHILPKYHCIRHFDLSLMLSFKLHVTFISYKMVLIKEKECKFTHILHNENMMPKSCSLFWCCFRRQGVFNCCYLCSNKT